MYRFVRFKCDYSKTLVYVKKKLVVAFFLMTAVCDDKINNKHDDKINIFKNIFFFVWKQINRVGIPSVNIS